MARARVCFGWRVWPLLGVVSVITNDGRNIVGVLRGFDQTNNLILDECHERVYSTKVRARRVRAVRQRCGVKTRSAVRV